MAHMLSQEEPHGEFEGRLTEVRHLCGLELGSLHVCCGSVAWCSCGMHNSGGGAVPGSVPGTLSFYWVASSSLAVRTCAWPYCHF